MSVNRFVRKIVQAVEFSRNVSVTTLDTDVTDKKILDELEMTNISYIPGNILATFKEGPCHYTTIYIDEFKTKVVLQFNDKITTTYRDKIVEYLVIYIGILERVFKKHRDNVMIMFKLSSEVKEFPYEQIEGEQYITCEHVNSGLSWCIQDPIIVIFRAEELLKVLIHEMLHVYGTHPLFYNKRYDDIIQRKYDILTRNNSLNLFEAYVETLALTIHTIIYTLSNRSILRPLLIDVKRNIDIEIQSSTTLASDIHFLLGGKPLRESSNVFSYYFLKLSFIQNLGAFFKFIELYDYVMCKNTVRYMKFVNRMLCKLRLNKVKHVSSSSMKMSFLCMK
jgi:hypothetical protein